MADRDLTPAVTDADREAADDVLETWNDATNDRSELLVLAQAIARARADADEAGYSRGLREGAASEMEFIFAEIANRCMRQVGSGSRAKYLVLGYNRCMDDLDRSIAAIRARSEGGKA